MMKIDAGLAEENHTEAKRTFSIIVPTLNRPDDLRRMLLSVLEQRFLPLEVIIVDQSNDYGTESVVESLLKRFQTVGVQLIYRHLAPPGLTRARNEGLNFANGEYLTFLDDDVVLEPEYFEELDKTIARHEAIVVQGIITNYHDRYKPILYPIMRLFRLSFPSKASGVVYSSFGNVLPVRFEKEIPCMWASGCNHTIKTSVAREQKYDENLISYGLGEDVDMTFRVYKLYPEKVWASPRARLVHLESQQQRIGDRRYIFMEAVHRRYLFYKNIGSSLSVNLEFAWSRIGVLVVCLLRFIQRPGQFSVNLLNLRHTISAELFALRNRERIINGDLKFFHKWFAESSE